MPQLDITTYTSQVFWLAIIFSIMFGASVGLFLPKISRIFQKRFDSKKYADAEILSLQESVRQLQDTYTTKKELAIAGSQEYIDQELAKINTIHEKHFQSLEREIQQEIIRLQESHTHQFKNFNDNYAELINEGVEEILAKLGLKNGR